MYTYPTQQSFYPGYISPNQSIPTFSNFNSSAQIDSLDWPFLDTIDPALCSTKEYKHIIKEISRRFVRTTIIDLGSPNRMINLLRILQVIISTLSSECKKCVDEIEDLRQNYRILHKKYENERHRPAQVQNVTADRCPICQKPFKTLQHLDLHIFSKHPEVSTLWQAIRTPQPPGAFSFPWQKSHSITSTMYPQSTQNTNDQAVQNLLDDFRKRFVNEQKASEKEMQEWFDKKMSKVETKIETLQQAAKNEIIKSKMNAENVNKNSRKSHHHKKKDNRRHHHKKEFDPSRPFNSPYIQQQTQPPQTIQIPQPQTAQPPKPPAQPQPNQQQHEEDIEDGELIVQPVSFIDNHQSENDQNHQKSAANSMAGSIASLELTSNLNFQSPAPKSQATGSDAEYESPPSIDNFGGDQIRPQNSEPSQIHKSGHQSQIEGISGSQNSEPIQNSGHDFTLSQNSEFNPIQPTPKSTPMKQKRQQTSGQTNPQDFDHEVGHDDYDFNDEDSNHLQMLPGDLSRSFSPNEGTIEDGNFVTSYVQPQDDRIGGTDSNGGVDSDNYTKQLEGFNTSDLYRATPPPGKSHIRHSSSAEGEKNPPKPHQTQPANKLNNIEIGNDYEYYYSEEPNFRPGKGAPYKGGHFDNNEELISKNNYDDEFNGTGTASIPNIADPGRDEFEIDGSGTGVVVGGAASKFYNNEDDYDEVGDDEFGGGIEGDDFDDDGFGRGAATATSGRGGGATTNGSGRDRSATSGGLNTPGRNDLYGTRDDGIIDSSFHMDSIQDLPELTDSLSDKKAASSRRTFRNVSSNFNKSRKSSSSKAADNLPSEKFRKETYHKSATPNEDLDQMYNDIIHSTSDGL